VFDISKQTQDFHVANASPVQHELDVNRTSAHVFSVRWPVVRLQSPGAKRNGTIAMHVSRFALALVFSCSLAPASAQSVIDVEAQKAAPAQVQDQGQSQTLPQPPTQTPESSQAAAIDRAGLETEIASLRKEVASLKNLDTEIARLKDEIVSLKNEIAVLKEPPPPRPSADLTSPADKDSDLSIKLPTQQDIARARAYLEETWRRLVEMVVAMQKDIMRKG
jgi:cell division protein FtsB